MRQVTVRLVHSNSLQETVVHYNTIEVHSIPNYFTELKTSDPKWNNLALNLKSIQHG